MAITSQLRPNPGLGDAWIDHWQAAGLLKPSVVKPVFATLERRLGRPLAPRKLGPKPRRERDTPRQAQLL